MNASQGQNDMPPSFGGNPENYHVNIVFQNNSNQPDNKYDFASINQSKRAVVPTNRPNQHEGVVRPTKFNDELSKYKAAVVPSQNQMKASDVSDLQQ